MNTLWSLDLLQLSSPGGVFPAHCRTLLAPEAQEVLFLIVQSSWRRLWLRLSVYKLKLIVFISIFVAGLSILMLACHCYMLHSGLNQQTNHLCRRHSCTQAEFDFVISRSTIV